MVAGCLTWSGRASVVLDGRRGLERSSGCRAPVAPSASVVLDGLDLDEFLQHEPHRLADQIHAVTGAESVQQIGDGDCDRAIGDVLLSE